MATSLRSSALFVTMCMANGHAWADSVNTLDGAHLTGTIDKITPKTLELKTAYAGTLTIQMDQVASLSTDQPLTTQLTDATTITGTTALEAKTLRVTSGTGSSAAALDQ